ncbi:MAG: hypothetical protein FWD89_01040 [Firmicutes bacterium]|nr:hypothetical protein [Bacillota bacterium]
MSKKDNTSKLEYLAAQSKAIYSLMLHARGTLGGMTDETLDPFRQMRIRLDIHMKGRKGIESNKLQTVDNEMIVECLDAQIEATGAIIKHIGEDREKFITPFKTMLESLATTIRGKKGASFTDDTISLASLESQSERLDDIMVHTKGVHGDEIEPFRKAARKLIKHNIEREA